MNLRGAEICRCIWSMLKEERVYVSIPYAERVQFSSSVNRRNPAILFDLIKCHALFFKEQRESFSPDGEGNKAAIRATTEDFMAAARIYEKINGDSGGQETKLTKNEAGALKIICKMGWDEVTLKMLQNAMGISYYQAKRIFNGYSNGGNTYSGLLEKCPAIGFSDATVSHEGDCSVIRRRENYYSFNFEIYKKWSSTGMVWIDEDPGCPDNRDDPGDGSSPGSQDVCTCAPDVHRMCIFEVHTKKPDESGSFTDLSEINKKLLLNNVPVHQNEGAQKGYSSSSSPSLCVCSPCTSAHEYAKTNKISFNGNRMANGGSLTGTSKVHGSAHECPCAHENLKGREDLSLPLPGVLDSRDFERVNVELGKCSLCGEGKAVFSSKGLRMSICEGCFGRLLRDELREEGVR